MAGSRRGEGATPVVRFTANVQVSLPSGPDVETLDVELHLAFGAYSLHDQMVPRDDLLAAVTSLPVPWAAPDAVNTLVRQEVAVLKLGSDVET